MSTALIQARLNKASGMSGVSGMTPQTRLPAHLVIKDYARRYQQLAKALHIYALSLIPGKIDP